jgi:hypothetical protein
MNRNTGLIAGLVAVVTLVGFSTLSNRSPQNSQSATSGKSPAPSAKVQSTSEERTSTASLRFQPCAEIRQRLARFVEAQAPVNSWKLPDSCYEPGENLARPERVRTFRDVQFAIALVPNPVSTHLPLLFDRIVEATQQAAQDDGYSYDASWFPWDSVSESYSSLSDKLAAEELEKIRQAQPGVIVFRGPLEDDKSPPYQRGLVIFLAAEQPTGGVSDDELENAIAWIRGFESADAEQPLRILGPTFSGSLPSLRRVLERLEHDERYLPISSLRKSLVSSGTANDASSFHWFQNWIRGEGGEFRTALENDSLMLYRFCHYLQKEGYLPNRVAVLSEDETAFGGGPLGPKSAPDRAFQQGCGDPEAPFVDAIRVYYPRDIATLRSAYEQQSILSSAKPESSANAPSTTLRADLSEPASSERDTVRTYGGQLTPLDQESILLATTNLLKEHQVQFIILRSTNSLDQIFLSEFLRRTDPGARVVIDGADLLFSRGAEGRSLRGVMLLSTYPLVTLQSDWTPSLLDSGSRSYRRFSQDASEGLSIAARELFDPHKQSRVPIRDYAPPRWAIDPRDDHTDRGLPATWISVIGHGRFWPVAALTSAQEGSILPSSFHRGDGSPLDDADPRPLRLPTAMWMLLIACLVWSAVHLYFCWQGSITGSPRARAYFAPIPRWQHPVLIALGSLFLAMLAVVVAGASGLLSWLIGPGPSQPLSTTIPQFLLVLLILAFSFFACKKNYGLPVANGRPGSDKSANKQRQRYAVVAALVCLAAFALLQMVLVKGLTRENGFPVYWRNVNLFSGVSPLLPRLLLIAGMYLWFWFSLRGLAHFGEDRPLLPLNADLLKSDRTPLMPMFSREGAGQPVERAGLPLTQRYWVTLLVLFGITVTACRVALHEFRVTTLGERVFGMTIFFWICVCIAMIVADAIQFWWVWSGLHRLLVNLDRLPLRRTLWALRGVSWKSIWRMSGNVFEEQYRMISRQLESLTHLENAVKAWVPAKDDPEESKSDERAKDEVLARIEGLHPKRTEFAKWYVTLPEDKPVEDLGPLREIKEELASIAGLLMNNVLVPAWRRESKSLIFLRAGSEGKAGEDRETEATIPSSKLPAHVRAAEEFFVLPYLGFIQNILGRMRTMVLSSLALFVGTTLAASSYPFEPLNVLGGVFLTVFAIVGGLSILVYSQMSRDATLSHITNRRPGELGTDFWLKMVTFGIGPLLGLLTTLFPSITNFVFSWLQPGTQAVK